MLKYLYEKAYLIIIFGVIALVLMTAMEHEKKEREEKSQEVSMASQEPSAREDWAAIFFQDPERGRVVERIDMNSEEPISGETFNALIRRAQEAHAHFILARVQTRDENSGREFVHYYDASSIISWIWGYPLPDRDIRIEGHTNPINRLPLSKPIKFFIYNPVTKLFDFFKEDTDLWGQNQESLRILFNAQQLNNLNVRAAALLDIGKTLMDSGDRQSLNEGLGHLIFVANQTDNPAVQILAQRYLGDIYANGLGVKRDYKKAREYYELVRQQNSNEDAQLYALYRLGEMAFGGLGGPKQIGQARLYFNAVAHQQTDLALRDSAEAMLKEMDAAEKHEKEALQEEDQIED